MQVISVQDDDSEEEEIEDDRKPSAAILNEAPVDDLSNSDAMEVEEEEPELYTNRNMANGRYGKIFARPETPPPDGEVLLSPPIGSYSMYCVQGKWIAMEEAKEIHVGCQFVEMSRSGRWFWRCNSSDVEVHGRGQAGDHRCNFINVWSSRICTRCHRGMKPFVSEPPRRGREAFRSGAFGDFDANQHNVKEWTKLYGEHFFPDGTVKGKPHMERSDNDDGWWRSKSNQRAKELCLKQLRNRVHASKRKKFNKRVKMEEKELEKMTSNNVYVGRKKTLNLTLLKKSKFKGEQEVKEERAKRVEEHERKVRDHNTWWSEINIKQINKKNFSLLRNK